MEGVFQLSSICIALEECFCFSIHTLAMRFYYASNEKAVYYMCFSDCGRDRLHTLFSTCPVSIHFTRGHDEQA